MERLAGGFKRSLYSLRATCAHVALAATLMIPLFLCTPAAAWQPSPDFVRDIQPILAEKCYPCHSAARSMGGIRLDGRAGAFGQGESRTPAIVPGRSAASELLRRVSAPDKSVRMPLGGQPLTPAQIELLRTWIDSGANWPDTPAASTRKLEKHWAFQQLRKVQPPSVKNAGWAKTGVDGFILAQLEAKGLTPAPEATTTQLIRRVTFGLTGLPPDPADATNRDFDALVDRLLASPQYGERWGRHWLDVARYADSEGYHEDADRPTMYRYRDWVIRAFNEDIRFDQFVRWQLAGDEYGPDNPDAVAATGFLAAGTRVFIAATDTEENKQQYLYDELDDFVSTTSAAMLGLTVGCARCHDHKFDPIPTRDYYRMAAAFRNYDRTETFLSRPHRELERMLAARRAALRESKMDAAAIPEDMRVLLRAKLDKDNSGQKAAFDKYDSPLRFSDDDFHAWLTPSDKETLARLRGAVAEAEKTLGADPPRSFVIVDSQPKPMGAYLLARGSVRNKTELVPFGFLSVLSNGREPEQYRASVMREAMPTSYQRSALAEWLVDEEHGAGALLARVIVNRIWQHHFGEGLVRTPNDFGSQGERPSHPELLDWLAGELIRGGWRLKPIHRLILNSAVYRMSAVAAPESVRLDPENRLWAHRRPLQLEAESLRDSILAVSGSLNRQMFGPPVRPPIAPEAINSRSADRWPKNAVDGPDTWRRSVYVFAKRSIRLPMLETFDAPDSNTSCGRRVPTTAPTQALMLMNDSFVREQAERFARRVAAEAPESAASQIQRAYQLALGREAGRTEMQSALRFLSSGSLTDLCHVLFTLNEFMFVD